MKTGKSAVASDYGRPGGCLLGVISPDFLKSNEIVVETAGGLVAPLPLSTSLRFPTGMVSVSPFAKILFAINGLGATASLAFLLFTWHAESIIVEKARMIALEQTRAYLEPVIPRIEKLLAQPLVSRTLPPPVRAKLEWEISDYHESPDRWLTALATANRDRAAEFRFPEVKNPFARATLDFLVARLSGARAHFESSFGNLIRNLRIFATTNLFAFLIAAGLCLVAKAPRWRFWLTVWSGLLLVATLLSMLLYQDQNWIWNILLNRYHGWGYLAFHLLVTLRLAYEILPEIRRAPELRSILTKNEKPG
jgi:hypothetical protein